MRREPVSHRVRCVLERVNSCMEPKSERQTPLLPPKVVRLQKARQDTNDGVADDQDRGFRPAATHACLTEVTVVPNRLQRLAAARSVDSCQRWSSACQRR